MLIASLVVLVLAAGVLLAAVVVADVDLVLLSVAGALASGGLLALGLARNRPGRPPRAPTWAGASERPERPVAPNEALDPGPPPASGQREDWGRAKPRDGTSSTV